jgi:hypothetical protein
MAVNDKSQQQRRLEQAERMLKRIQDQEEKARKLVELERQRLDAFIAAQDAALQGPADVIPGLSSASPAGFNSQYDQFGNTLSSKRLSAEPADILRSDLLQTPRPMANKESYSFGDQDTHFETLGSYPGVPVYASGYYFSSGDVKRYEYKVEPSAYPISIGDQVMAPVHLKGYHQSGNPRHTHDRRFIVTDIYTRERFLPYHDDIK